jgi:hypothetical protein
MTNIRKVREKGLNILEKFSLNKEVFYTFANFKGTVAQE